MTPMTTRRFTPGLRCAPARAADEPADQGVSRRLVALVASPPPLAVGLRPC
jgi:hypothetical protein